VHENRSGDRPNDEVRARKRNAQRHCAELAKQANGPFPGSPEKAARCRSHDTCHLALARARSACLRDCRLCRGRRRGSLTGHGWRFRGGVREWHSSPASRPSS
jgi:hypothetical protein